MLNFEDFKAKVAAMLTTEELKVLPADIEIGFLKRTYEIFINVEGLELTKKNIADIVTLLGQAVVKTIAFVSGGEKSITVVFDMNYMD